MLTPEQYQEWEKQQQAKMFLPPDSDTFPNYDFWKITRYDNNLHRYHIRAKDQNGAQYSAYIDRGRWSGGREIENRLYEELGYQYRNTPGAKITRSSKEWNIKFFEVTVYGSPESAFMIVDGSKKYAATKVSRLKDAYRWHMELIAV